MMRDDIPGSPGTVWSAKGAGIFTWHIESNVVHSDPVVADLFGLNENGAQTGLPLQSYVACIHDGDRARVAKAIHTAILSGKPYQEEYRLVRSNRPLIWVLAIGHCFRNHLGEPSDYAGIVYDITEEKISATDGISNHCLAALGAAKRIGNERLVTLLSQALEEAGEADLRQIIQKSMMH